MAKISPEELRVLIDEEFDIDLPGCEIRGRDGREKAGVYLEQIDDRFLDMLGSKEVLTIRSHPTGDPMEPVLTLPCTAGELLQFLERFGRLSDDVTRTYVEAIRKLQSTKDHDKPWEKEGIGKREGQFLVIEHAIDLKAWNRFAVPVGEQCPLEEICKQTAPNLFDRPSSFAGAWKAGTPDRWRMANYDQAASRPNKERNVD